MKKLLAPFRDLTRFEVCLWLFSVAVVSVCFLVAPDGDPVSLAASLTGVTALIFVAKGYVLGQALTVVFAVFYGIISWYYRYYGEMITYLGMSAPMAGMCVVSWLRNPFAGTKEVAVGRMTGRKTMLLVLCTIAVTIVFWFVLGWLDNANLMWSTLSVTTSFFAASLVYLRSPWYAIAYAFNDVVLIVLWVLAALTDLSCLPMVFCFVMFLANDVYGFISWKRMARRQAALSAADSRRILQSGAWGPTKDI